MGTHPDVLERQMLIVVGNMATLLFVLNLFHNGDFSPSMRVFNMNSLHEITTLFEFG